jgi:subtilisin family serine protease
MQILHTGPNTKTPSVKRATVAVFLGLLTTLLSGQANAQSTNTISPGGGQRFHAVQDAPGGPSYAEGEILVKFRPGATDQQVSDLVWRAAVTGAKHILTPSMRKNADIGITRLTVALPVAQALQALQNHPGIEYAQPNWVYYHHQGGTTLPSTFDDPYYQNGSLWGAFDGSSPWPMTQNAYGSGAADAWAAGFTGSGQVFVGVIDEGIQFEHPDLAANIWTNPREIAGNNIDDDGDGYIDDVHGWNALAGNGNIYAPGYDDHGTHVAGTIGAVGANGCGVAGINWNVSIISGKFLGPDGGITSDAIEAIDYITHLKDVKGLNIVALNNSWGGGGYDPALLGSITRAAQRGILFVAAAGNGDFLGRAINTDTSPNYPSCYDTSSAAGYDSVIAVTAIDRTGAKASWANYGAHTVDLGAPGVDIWSTLPGGSYGSYDGTSMATPHVTGAIALYKSAHPNAAAADIKSALLGSSASTPSLATITTSGGRLDIPQFLTGPSKLRQ